MYFLFFRLVRQSRKQENISLNPSLHLNSHRSFWVGMTVLSTNLLKFFSSPYLRLLSTSIPNGQGILRKSVASPWDSAPPSRGRGHGKGPTCTKSSGRPLHPPHRPPAREDRITFITNALIFSLASQCGRYWPEFTPQATVTVFTYNPELFK